MGDNEPTETEPVHISTLSDTPPVPKNIKKMATTFEKNSTMIYPLDTVKVSDRTYASRKSPFRGKLGTVYSIRHGFMSQSNRRYMIVELLGNQLGEDSPIFSTPYHTLDIVEKDQNAALRLYSTDKFGCQIYLDDRVEVDEDYPEYGGLTGKIVGLSATSLSKGALMLELLNEGATDNVNLLYSDIRRDIEDELKQRDIEGGCQAFIDDLLLNNRGLYEFLESKDRLEEVYQESLRQEIYRNLIKSPPILESLAKILENNKFEVSANNVQLLEREPDNDKFSDLVEED